MGNFNSKSFNTALEHEYGAKCEFQAKPYSKACWIESDNEDKMSEFRRIKAQDIVRDKDGLEVYLAPLSSCLNMEIQNFPEITFHFTSEFKTAQEECAIDALYLEQPHESLVYMLRFGFLLSLLLLESMSGLRILHGVKLQPDTTETKVVQVSGLVVTGDSLAHLCPIAPCFRST